LAISTLITGTPWGLVVEYPENTILAPARKVLLWIVIAGLFILLTGVLVGRKMSRGISFPLKQLTVASTQLASGNYSGSIVHTSRLDELGKLARAFNAMSVKVESSQNTLELEARKYRILFERNPMPMLIISRITNVILDVNESAIRHYGYSINEFLAMKAVDLRPEEEKGRYLQHISDNNGATKTGVWKHMKKDGTIIMVDIIGDDIEYKGEPCRIILSNDITEKLQSEQQLIEYQVNQHKRMTEVAIEAQEKEREEIGKELHDNVNQILASIKLHLELARNSPEGFPEAITNSYEYVNLAIKEIRHLSKSLVRPSLEYSLVMVISELLKETETLTGLNIDFNYQHFNEKLLTENSELMLYRILQEQLNNIIKHARATEVNIQLFNTEESCIMNITDNGVGFDTTEKAKGIGLRNIENRVRFYKGICKITSQPGMGTSLRLSFPLPVRA
jgi:PAS domain S-box-containing protein